QCRGGQDLGRGSARDTLVHIQRHGGDRPKILRRASGIVFGPFLVDRSSPLPRGRVGVRARYFSVLLLIVIAALPLGAAGLVMVRRAEQTALDEVRSGNANVAVSVAARIEAFVGEKVNLLKTFGAVVSPAVQLTPTQAEQIVRDYQLMFPRLESLDVVGPTCHDELATSDLQGGLRDRCDDPVVVAVLAGETRLS